MSSSEKDEGGFQSDDSTKSDESLQSNDSIPPPPVYTSAVIQATERAIHQLDDPNIELWLVSVPHHDTLRAALPGTKLRLPRQDDRASSSHAEQGKMGVLKGSYVFRDDATPNAMVRAAVVANDEQGKPVLKLAKPFARSVNVSFDTELMSLAGNEAAQKEYPKAPDALKQQYFPIGVAHKADASSIAKETNKRSAESEAPDQQPNKMSRQRNR